MANRAGETYTVHLYQGETHEFQIPRKSKPPALLDACCQHLEIEETDYFSLYTHVDGNRTLWLQSDKPLRKQLVDHNAEVYFGVKFYHMDPTKLYTEQTRLYFVYQIIDDIKRNKTNIAFMEDELNLITSLYIQSQLGDYEEGAHLPGYTKDLLLFDFQTPDLEDEMIRFHKDHSGKTPAECEAEILKMATNKRLYGLHIVHCTRMVGRDQENLNVGIHPAGIVYLDEENNPTHEFAWPLVAKLVTKRRKFILRIRNPVSPTSDEVQSKQDRLGMEETDSLPNKLLESKEKEEDVKPAEETDVNLATKGKQTDDIQPSEEQVKVEEPKVTLESAKGKRSKQNILVHKLLLVDKMAAKNLWRLAVEHHMFFQRESVPEVKFSLFRIGSRYRYSGRTFRQAQQVHSTQSFTPFNPEVRNRVSQRKRKDAGQDEIDPTSSFSGHVRLKETTIHYSQEHDEQPSGISNAIEIPPADSEEAAVHKEVTEKFLEQEYERAANKNTEDLPPPPDQETLSKSPELENTEADTVPEMPPPAPNNDDKTEDVSEETREREIAIAPED